MVLLFIIIDPINYCKYDIKLVYKYWNSSYIVLWLKNTTLTEKHDDIIPANNVVYADALGWLL